MSPDSPRPISARKSGLPKEAQDILQALTGTFLQQGVYAYDYEPLRYRFMDHRELLDDPLVRKGFLCPYNSTGGWQGPHERYRVSILSVTDPKHRVREVGSLAKVMSVIEKLYRKSPDARTFEDVTRETGLDLPAVTRCFYYCQELLYGTGLRLVKGIAPSLEHDPHRLLPEDRTFAFEEGARDAGKVSLKDRLEALAESRVRIMKPGALLRLSDFRWKDEEHAHGPEGAPFLSRKEAAGLLDLSLATFARRCGQDEYALWLTPLQAPGGRPRWSEPKLRRFGQTYPSQVGPKFHARWGTARISK